MKLLFILFLLASCSPDKTETLLEDAEVLATSYTAANSGIIPTIGTNGKLGFGFYSEPEHWLTIYKNQCGITHVDDKNIFIYSQTNKKLKTEIQLDTYGKRVNCYTKKVWMIAKDK